MAKHTPQANLFVIINKIKTAITLIFWAIFVLSIIPSIVKTVGLQLNLEDTLNAINIICLSLFFVLETVVDYILVPQANSVRRDDFIDNSFGSSFSHSPSVGYFDTDEIQLGIYKAACNLFENCFFMYMLAKALTIRKTILPALVLLFIITVAYYGFKEAPFALSLLQTLFSTTLLGEIIKHCILLARLHTIHDSWISLFQQQDFKANPEKFRANIYRYWLQYETLHSRIQIHIPDRLFRDLNPKLTQHWNEIKIRYNIS